MIIHICRLNLEHHICVWCVCVCVCVCVFVCLFVCLFVFSALLCAVSFKTKGRLGPDQLKDQTFRKSVQPYFNFLTFRTKTLIQVQSLCFVFEETNQISTNSNFVVNIFAFTLSYTKLLLVLHLQRHCVSYFSPLSANPTK